MAVGKKTGGRQKGTKNKFTSEVKDLFRQHAPVALDNVVRLMASEDERVSFAASQEILNRAYGKPAQAHTGEGGEGPVRIKVITGVPRGESAD